MYLHEIILLFKYTEEALPHRDLFPFRGWSHHRSELVVVIPLMGQAISLVLELTSGLVDCEETELVLKICSV